MAPLSLLPMHTIHGAPSHRLASDCVELFVTSTAGMLAPVHFTLGERAVSPYALAPWVPDELDPDLPPLLRYLRGDFLCLPFGPQDDGPPHGDPANADWSLVEQGPEHLHLTQQAADSGASVDKWVRLRSGETALYLEHRISGLEGRWSYGSHPVLDLSGLPEGGGRVTTSPFRWGSVNPGLFSDPANEEFQILVPGAPFTDLAAVPQAASPPSTPEGVAQAGTADLTHYPSRAGFEDLIMLANNPATPDQPFAWTACVLDGYLWFCLKDPETFPATLFWMSNGGRKAGPWNGNHLGRLGLEEVCSHFADPVTVSREDRLAEQGIPTTRAFTPDETASLRLIQAVAAVPPEFDSVTRIAPDGEGRVTITSANGVTVTAAVDWRFVL